MEAPISFPFTSTLTVSYKNNEGDVHITDNALIVDNFSFFK